MRAGWYDKTGPAYEVVKTGEMETPKAGPGEVLLDAGAEVRVSDFTQPVAEDLRRVDRSRVPAHVLA